MALDRKVFLARFVEETTKHCERLEKEILALEAEKFSTDRVAAVFRIVHTLKGAARMMKLPLIAEVAHRMEDVLEQLRLGSCSLSQQMTDLLLAGVDTVRTFIPDVAADKPLPEELPPVCRQLENLLQTEKKMKKSHRSRPHNGKRA